MRDQKRWMKNWIMGIGCGNDDHCSGSLSCYGSRKRLGQ